MKDLYTRIIKHTTLESDTMTHVKLRILILTVLLLGAVIAPRVSAQESNVSVQQQAIERCTLSQNYLRNIQKPRDLRARVDRLQAYRYIYQRLDIFVRRLERNSQPEAANLRASLNQFNVTIEAFKNNYETYDAARESLTEVKDCRKNIGTFQQKLQNVREKRQLVHDQVIAIEELLNPRIDSELNTLYQSLLATGSTGAINE